MLLDKFRRRSADERRLSRAGADDWQAAAGSA
jgi:hypothetical protein